MNIKNFTSTLLMMLLLFITMIGGTGCGGGGRSSNQPENEYTPETVFTVTFDSNGGSSVPSQNVVEGEKAVEPTTPTKDGYTFGGWYTDADLTIRFSFSTPITANITLYARWNTLSVTTYTVTFDSNGGSKVSSIVVPSGSTISAPENPTKAGYVFAGWYKDSEFAEMFVFGVDGDKVTRDITLYARWLDADLLIAEYAASKIAIGYANGDGSKHVTKNLTLPVKIGSVDISWSSSSGAVETDGTVTRQAEDVYVTLTATATYNGKSAEPKTFSVRVIRKRTRDNSTIKAFTIEDASSGDIEVTRNDSGDVTDIEGQYVSFDIHNADDALDAITVLREELGIRSPDKELETFLVTSDAYGAEYQFQQTYEGVKVFGRALMASANSSNKGDFLHSTFLSSDILEKAEMKISISSSEAEEIAKNNFGGAVKTNTGSTEIVVYSLAEYESKPVFAYIINVEGFDSKGSYIDEDVFVNAQTSSVICSFTNIHSETRTGTGRNEQNTADLSFPVVFDAEETCYYMRDPDLDIRMYEGYLSDDNEIYSSEVDFWPDGHQNSAYSNIREVMKWWRTSFDRNSLDDKGMTVRVITHQQEDCNKDGIPKKDNACWWEGKNAIYIYDIGNRSKFAYSQAVAIDTFAHETTHAVIQFDVPGGLLYENVTGAIDEGYADVFGCLKDRNWFIDEYSVQLQYLCGRNISAPYDTKATKQGPSKIGGEYYIEPVSNPNDENDHGGVHTNSFIVSYAAYLMHQDHTSGGLTWEELGQVWYKSLHLGLSSKSDFNDVRRCVVWAARKCKLAPASKYEAIDKAFDEVGITVSKAVLYGTITDYDTSKPISGVTVGALVGYSSSRANTDSKGYFSISVNEGNAFIYTIANGYVPFVAEKELKMPDNKLDIKLVKPGAGSISGRIISSATVGSNTPIEGVTVKIRGGWNNQEAGAIFTTTTDSNGQYQFDLGENGAGYYTIEMSKDGRTEIFNVSVSGATTEDVYFDFRVGPKPIDPDIPVRPEPVVSEDIQIDEAHFPDENFREYLVNNLDINEDGILNKAEILGTTSIDIAGTYDKSGNIVSLKGIEYFTALQELNCRNNQLIELNVSKNTALRELFCDDNQLIALDVSKNTALQSLSCSYNQLTVLDVSGCTALEYLGCNDNQLTALDLGKNTALQALDCDNNKLTTLEVGECIAMQSLWCSYNQLTALDMSKNSTLQWLSCVGNHRLTELNISGCTALETLECFGNSLTELDVSDCTSLQYLSCADNQLITLDVSKNTALQNLSCGNNKLTALDVSKNTALQGLSCEDNQLTVLDISNNTALQGLVCENNRLTALNVSGCTALQRLYCENNQLTALDLSKNTAMETLSCSKNQLTALDLSHCPNLNIWNVNCDSEVTIIWPASTASSVSALPHSDSASTILAVLPFFTPDESGTYSFTVSLDRTPPEDSFLLLLSDSEDLNASFATTNEVETVRVSADFTAGRLYAPVIVATSEGESQSGGCNAGIAGIILLAGIIIVLSKIGHVREMRGRE